MDESDDRDELIEAAKKALDTATNREELLAALDVILTDARQRLLDDEAVPGLPLDTAAFHLSRGSRWWQDAELALGGALIAEAASYVEQSNPSFHFIALADSVAASPGSDPRGFNTVIARGVSLGSRSGHFGRGLSMRRLLAEDWIDGRGLLHVVDRLLDRAPAGSPDRPLLLLDRAQALLNLARRAGGDERILALARRALADGTSAQNELSIGADDAMFWLERPFVASAPELEDDETKRFVGVVGNLNRALRAAAERGDQKVTDAAVNQALDRLTKPGPPVDAEVAAARAGLARGLLAFPLPPNLESLVLYILSENLSLSYVLDKRRRSLIVEAERAARAGLEKRPDWPPLQQAIIHAISSRGDSARTAAEAIAARDALQELGRTFPPTWMLFASQASIGLRAVELGSDPRELYAALGALDALAQLDPAIIAEHADKELSLRVRCLVRLAGADPAFALPELEALTRDRPAGRATGDVLVLRTESALTVPVADASAAARALLAEESLWEGSHTEHLLGIVGTLRRGSLRSALPRLLPSGVSEEQVIRELIDSEPSESTRIMLDRRMTDPSETGQAELALKALSDPGLDEKLRAIFRVTVGVEALTSFGRTGDPADLDRAAEYMLPSDPADDEASDNKLGILGVLDGLAARTSQPLVSDSRRVMLLQWIISDPAMSLSIRFICGTRLQLAFGGIWPMVWSQFESLIGPLQDAVRSGDAAEALEYAQGMASRAAYAAVRHGDALRAVEVAERGQGVLAAAAMRQHGVTTELLHLDHPQLYAAWALAARRLQSAVRAAVPKLDAWNTLVPSEPPTRMVSPVELLNELSEASPRVAELVAAERAARSDLESVVGPLLPDPSAGELVAHLQATGARLVYLIATGWGGMAVVLHPDARTTVVDLPNLESSVTSAWIESVNAAPPEPIARDAAVRGSASEPPQATTEQVLRDLSAALSPLSESLASADTPVQLVPMGALAQLPLVAALQWDRADDEWFELSVAASGRLHMAAATRLARTSGNTAVVAVTNPAPATRPDGSRFRDLPAATREGDEVATLFGGTHHTRDAATLAASIAALGGANRVLHFAVHGEADGDAPERSRMYLADEPGGFATELTAGEVARSPINSRLVYLGSCWTGRPGSRLPDEAVGFPTLLLQSGAAGVVAPLWPIDDAAAYTFAAAFYREWREGGTPARALAAAMRHTRAWHPRSMTWAAFSLHGV
jgi:CHAT domain-containing protein